jgi:phosphoglucomutase
MDTLAQARAGMASIELPEPVKQRALTELERWWHGESFASYRPAIQALVERGRFDELVDAFRQVLPFGTGGRRGSVGVGPNRMNPWTVGTSIQGHADWLKGRYTGEIGVVVAYDVRRFVDTRSLYGGEGPLRGLSSRDFAELAARVYSANGLVVHLLERGSERYVSTPELSFSIRELRATGGVNISASHNPPDDNGVKVYDVTGAQLAPPEDESLLEVVEHVEQVTSWTWEESVASGRVRWLSPEVHARYVAEVSSVIPPGKRSTQLLYTPLHGTGTVHEALAAAGFRCALHGPQAKPDGAFPTVPGGVANPESPQAMAHALTAAGPEIGLVFGTDPDADRLGCEVRHGDPRSGGAWVHLTGNEIAALVALARARSPGDGRRPLVVITEVTSTLVSRVAAACGAVVVDDLLVGFKYVAEGLRMLEEQGSWKGLDAGSVRFVAGAEESHGVLVTDRIRDKDAAGGAVVLAALADEELARGRTLVDVLEELRREHGEIGNDQVSLKYEGAAGQQRLADLLDGLRKAPPREIGGRAVVQALDHRDEQGRFGAFVSGSDRAARNVLVYKLGAGAWDEGARIILRPSGTEPKLKVYVEVLGRKGLSAEGVAGVRGEMGALCEAVKRWLA